MRMARTLVPRRRAAAIGFSVLLAALATGAAAQTAPPEKPGFPLSISGGGNLFLSEPLIVDLGLSTDGTKSIVFATFSGQLHVLYKNANEIWVEAPGFPKVIGSPVSSSPAAGDLDGDGKADLVVGFGSNGDFTKDGGVVAFKNNGTASWTQLWKVTTHDLIGASGGGPDGHPDPVVGTPAIGDIDGDGKNEVVFGSFDQFVYAVRGATGANLPGWPKFVRDTVWSSPALHDIDGDGKPDVVIGADAHAEGAPFNTPNGGCLHVFRYDSTQTCPDANPVDCQPPSEIAGFPKCIDQVITGGPVVGDIDGDGKPEIVHGTGTFYSGRAQRIYAYHADGSTVAGWPVAIVGQSEKTPALADLDGDGVLDVIVTADKTSPSTAYHLFAFHGDGTAVFPMQTVLDFGGVSLSAGSPLVADVLGPDGTPEILVSTNHSIAVFSNTGALLTEHTGNFSSSLPSFLSPGAPAIAAVDFENPAAAGAQIEVLAVGGPSGGTTEVDVWNPITRSSTPPWGLFHQNARRTGVAPGTPSGAGPCTPPAGALSFFTLTPCRLVDTRSPAAPLGNGQTRSFTLAGASCGVPASAKALAVNVTVTQPSGSGFLRFSPGGCAPLTVSTINFGAGQTRANNAVLPLADDGSGTVDANASVTGGGAVHLLIDVDGYFQ